MIPWSRRKRGALFEGLDFLENRAPRTGNPFSTIPRGAPPSMGILENPRFFSAFWESGENGGARILMARHENPGFEQENKRFLALTRDGRTSSIPTPN